MCGAYLSAATLDELHAVIDKHSSMLQTAGCFQYQNVVVDKKIIIKDLKRSKSKVKSKVTRFVK